MPFPKLARCQTCGADGQEKNVYEPFAHGWVGCKKCRRYVNWVKHGKLTAIKLWNEQNGKSYE